MSFKFAEQFRKSQAELWQTAANADAVTAPHVPSMAKAGGRHYLERKLNLYLISQAVRTGSETYDSAVVCAESEKDAINIHPSGKQDINPDHYERYGSAAYSWCKKEDVKVKLIGKAEQGTEAGVICASFNAG